jgi:hypothetical protein
VRETFLVADGRGEIPKFGWSRDPFGLHEFRYFSLGQPTKLVRDGSVEAYDEPPVEFSDGSDAVAPLYSEPAPEAAAVLRVERVRFDSAGFHGTVAPQIENDGRRGALLPTFAALVLGGGILLGLKLTDGPATLPAAAASPRGFVLSAVSRTIAQGSATQSISGEFTAGGTNIPVQGTGNLDPASNSANLDVTMNGSVNGKMVSIAERELITGQNFYLGLTVDGVNAPAAVDPGKSWIQVPIPTTGSSTVGSADVNPVGMLEMAREHGAEVTPLGVSTINGIAAEEFQISLSQKAIDGVIQKGEAQTGVQMSPTQVQSVLSSARIDVWFDNSGLLRQESVQIGGSGASGDIVVTVESYGNPVAIESPPADQVMSLQSFQALAANSSNLSTSVPS